MDNKQKQTVKITLCVLALAVAIQTVSSVITVQIGGATRLTTLNRQRDRYRCYWDCDLVGCQIARDDDECAYDCEKICRLRDDYAAASGRSGAESKASAVEGLAPKSSYPMETLTGKMGALASSSAGQESADVNGQQNEISPEFLGGKYLIFSNNNQLF